MTHNHKTYPRLARLTDARQGGWLFLLCWGVYFVSYIGRYNYSAVMGTILQQNRLTLAGAGAVSTAYFFMYGVGQLIHGFASGRFSPYRMIFCGLLGSGLANLAMGFVPALGMVAVWAVNGFCQAMIWPPIIRLFSEALPERQQKRACVDITSTTPAGTLASYAVSAVVLTVSRWNATFWVCGATMLATALLWWGATHRLRRATAPAAPAQPLAQAGQTGKTGKTGQAEQKSKAAGGLWLLFAKAGILWLLLPVALHGALKDGVTSWVPTFVQSAFATTAAFSATVSMLLPLINLGGAYLADYLNRRWFHNEIKTCRALFLMAALALVLLPLAMRTSLVATMVLLAATTSAMLGINTVFIGILPVRAGKTVNAAAISGVLNATTYFGAALSSYGIGLSVENFGWNTTVLVWFGFAAVAALFCWKAEKAWTNYLATA
ncbi:MAG: MFS transporter [Gemmiger sp.]|nr:MFS transporter [Gemmiger sp.]